MTYLNSTTLFVIIIAHNQVYNTTTRIDDGRFPVYHRPLHMSTIKSTSSYNGPVRSQSSFDLIYSSNIQMIIFSALTPAFQCRERKNKMLKIMVPWWPFFPSCNDRGRPHLWPSQQYGPFTMTFYSSLQVEDCCRLCKQSRISSQYCETINHWDRTGYRGGYQPEIERGEMMFTELL